MADDSANPFERGQLKREATDWFIRLREEGSEALKPEFDAWLARGALHRAAYNRVANLYGAGKNVDWENLPPARPVRGAMKLTMLGALGALFLASFMIWRLLGGSLGATGPDQAQSDVKRLPAASQQLASDLGQIRRITLPDGSHVILDTDTLVTADFRADERELRLERGRARFEVAHERRPFVVDAGPGEVVAHGTVFDVSLEGNQVYVALLRGAVDVDMPGAGRNTIARHARLAPGQGIEFASAAETATMPRPAPRVISDWPSGFAEFDDAPLPSVLAAANRYSATKIRLGDPELAHLQVSGTFRVDDPSKLATVMTQLFHLRAEAEPGSIVLRPAPK